MKQNYLLILLRGEVPLAITFWVFMILLPTAINPILEKLNSPVLGIGISAYLAIALYNSACRYKGREIWKILAQICAVLLMVMATLRVYHQLVGFDDDAAYSHQEAATVGGQASGKSVGR